MSFHPARDVALDAAARLGRLVADPALRTRADERAHDRAGTRAPAAASLAAGDLGVMLVLHELADVVEEDRALLERAALGIALAQREADHDELSMITGSTGALAALADAWRVHGRRDLREAAEDLRDRVVDDVLLSPPPSFAAGCSMDDYDLISGAAGQLVALVHAHAVLPAHDGTLSALSVLRDHLHAAIEPAAIDPRLPACWIAPEYYGLESRDEMPRGYVNLGLAHGVPGILHALAVTALRTPLEVDVAAVDFATGVQLRHRGADPYSWGTGQPVGAPEEHVDRNTRVAWCYGTPGVAAALRTVADLRDDEELGRLAGEAGAACLDVPRPASGLISPTFCHGEAGVVAAAGYALGRDRETGEDGLGRHVAAILESADPQAVLGIRDERYPGDLVDDKGILTGASGVIHGLLAYARPERSGTALWSLLTGTGTGLRT